MLVCDICNQVVQRNEDVTYLEALYKGDFNIVRYYGPRHILCDYSRARYIQHPDLPTTYMPPFVTNSTLAKVVARRIVEWTNSWVQLQQVCGLTVFSGYTTH